MEGKIDLRELERKAYTAYHGDGLLDIFCGLVLVLLGLGWVGSLRSAIAFSSFAAMAFFLVGWLAPEAKRFHVYALLFVLVWIVSSQTTIHEALYTAGPGSVVLICGAFMLIRFLQRYPVLEQPASEDNDQMAAS